MRYTTLLFDLDHTLLDSDTSLTVAFEETMTAAGLDDAGSHYGQFDRINRALWTQVEQGTMTPPEVHVARFEEFASQVGVDAEPVSLASAYAAGLGRHGELYEGARELLEHLAEHATLAMVTNGLSDVQRTRIERLELHQYFDAIVISAELGVSKPAAGIFDATFEALGWPDKGTTIMIGDNLPSDIRGGADYGIATCWYNPTAKTTDADIVTHEVTDLAQIVDVVAGDLD